MFSVTPKLAIVNATEVQRDFPGIVARLEKSNVLVLRNNEPVAAIISPAAFQNLGGGLPAGPFPPAIFHFLRLLQTTSAVWRKNILSIRLYGSYARGDATPDSDIDLLVIVKRDSREWQKYLSGRCEEAMARSGYNDLLAVLSMTGAHWRRLKKSKALFTREVEREGIFLWKICATGL